MKTDKTMVEQIIRCLRGVKGNTLGEIFKSLHLFLRNNDNDIRPNIEALLLNFHPDNELEKFIRIKLIDRYKCYDEVLGILKSGDYFYISRVLQCTWFFSKSVFDSKLLVDNVFPLMSYSTRLKVLGRYSKYLKDTRVSDIFFNNLKEKYGICTALLILPACSEYFVSQILTSVYIQVPYSVVYQLYYIYPKVITNYLKFLLECSISKKRVFRQFNLNVYENIFRRIASVDPSEFYRMVEKYHSVLPCLRLGKRSTGRLIRSDFNSLKQNINKLKKFLDWKFLTMKLSIDQIEELQLTQAPSSISQFFLKYGDVMRVTVGMKHQIRQELLLKIFKKAYNKDIKDYIDVMDGDIVNVLPVDIREAWVDLKLTQADNISKKADYLIYLPTEKSVPALKQMIENQSVMETRRHISNCLFKTIKINNDWHLIGQLCEYIVKRFRNDQNIRETFMENVSHCRHVVQISNEDWVPIEELINIIILNDEAKVCLHFTLRILSIQILSRFQRNLPVEPYIERIFKLSDGYYEFNLCERTTYEKQCLLWFVQNFNQEQSKKKKDPVLVVNLFKRLCAWNGRHRTDQITVPGWILEQVEQVFHSEEYYYRKEMILDAVKRDFQMKHVLYNNIFPECCKPPVLFYKLHNDPKSLVGSIVTIMKKIFSDYNTSYISFFKRAKLYSNLNLPQGLCKVCLDVLHGKETSDAFSDKSKSIAVLSILLPTNRFVEVISEFYPKESTIGDCSNKDQEIYKIQRAISASLKLVNSPSEVLESLRKFAVGDFLKLVVGSIYSICLTTPEYKILPLLSQWLDCPVSLRKHFIRAFFRIAPIASSLDMIVGLFEIERNTSLRFLLFDHGRQFFIQEPCPETFAIFKAVIKKLTMSDDTALDKLFLMVNVPDDFISEYLQLIWDIIREKEEPAAKRYKNQIINNNIEASIIRLLKEEFCDELIEQVFEKAEQSMNLNIFVIRYLVCSRDLHQLNSRIEKVMIKIQDLVSKWNDFDLKTVCVFPSRNAVSCLVDTLICESFQVDDEALSTIDLLTKFRASLLALLEEDDVFEETLDLEISTFFHTSPGNSEIMFHFSNFIEPILERCTSVYGMIVIDTISQSIIKIFQWKFVDRAMYEHHLVNLSEILITTCSSTNCHILGLKMLPIVITSNISRYRKILNFIFQLQDQTVRMLANKLYKGLSSSVRVE